MLSGRRIRYELADRTKAIAHGGIGAMHQVAVQSGLVGRIDDSLELLKIHRPYHESDHVLNIAYSVLDRLGRFIFARASTELPPVLLLPGGWWARAPAL